MQMNYTYTARIDYFMIAFFFFGGGGIGYALEVGYLGTVGMALLIPLLIALFTYIHSDIKVELDGTKRQLTYSYSRWGNKITQTYLLDELTYDYRSMFTQHGKLAKLYIQQGKTTLLKPRVSACLLSADEQEHLANQLEKLNVKTL